MDYNVVIPAVTYHSSQEVIDVIICLTLLYIYMLRGIIQAESQTHHNYTSTKGKGKGKGSVTTNTGYVFRHNSICF